MKRSAKGHIEHLARRSLSIFEHVRDVQTVCLMLGPYRNLTTLTASILALHQNCQVLNHAGDDIYSDAKLNFLRDNDPETLDRFVKYALASSTRDAAGQTGGAITSSHAFRRQRMREVYGERFGGNKRKQVVRALVWKESLRTSVQLRESRHGIEDILARHSRLRFLMPIRSPLDCTQSNIRSGHVRLFPDINQSTGEADVLRAILAEIRWFLELHRKFPDRFFYYFQDDFDADTVSALGDFLKLPNDPSWPTAALKVYTLDSSYQHSSELLQFYRAEVTSTFAHLPRQMETLLCFAEPRAP